MLREIHIQNLGVIESARIEFQEGFHVISGETGAGKSILITAVDFALGARAESEILRSGQSEASVTLALEPSDREALRSILEAAGIGELDGEDGLYLRRTLNASGRSRAFINDQPVALKTLQAVGEASIHLVAQHATQTLLDENFLLQGLDRAGDAARAFQAYQEVHRRFRALRAEFLEWREKVERSREQEDFLRFQFQELEKAQLQAGEEEELEAKKLRLKYRVALAGQTFEMHEALLESEESVATRLGKIRHLAAKAAQLDPALQSVVECVEQAAALVAEAGRGLSHYSQGLEADPDGLDRIETRLASLSELKRKYRLEIPALIEKTAELKKQVEELEHFDDRLAAAERETAKVRESLEARAKALSALRQKAAQQLTGRLAKVLKELALPHARIVFQFQPIAEPENYSSWGSDRLSLLVSFNPGEELRPADQVASGGELSRMLLAFCETLSPAQKLGTMIFDEVDTGVGGKVAELIGKKLEELSRRVQVLCVTHLPQIACHASWHYSVEKEIRGGRTFSKIGLLQGEARVTEIARMLAGVKITAQALEHAKELLKNAAA